MNKRICFSIQTTWKYLKLEFRFQISYLRVVRIEYHIRPFVFWEKLRIDNFVSRSTDLKKHCFNYERILIQFLFYFLQNHLQLLRIWAFWTSKVEVSKWRGALRPLHRLSIVLSFNGKNSLVSFILRPLRKNSR